MLVQICKAEFSVESYMVDFRNKLRLSLLLGMQQETAFRHAEQLFAQYGNPAADNCFWVVTQSWTSILRMPRIKEHVNVETWIRSISRVSSRRNFRVTDAQGQVVALTSMDWVIVNLTTRRPQRLDGWNIDRELFRDVQASPLEGQRLRKIPELTPAYLKTVRYSDIDENNHANNTRYVDWILDSFGLDFLRQKEISHIYLCFKRECAPGDCLTIFTGAYPRDIGGNMCCGHSHSLSCNTSLRVANGCGTGQEAYYVEGRFDDYLNRSSNGPHGQAFQAEFLFTDEQS